MGLGLAAAWLAFAFGVVPFLIRQGYRGESFEAVNNVFGGRNQTPLDAYLGEWWVLAIGASTGLLALGVMAFAWMTRPVGRRKLIDRLLGGRAPVSPGTLVRFACLAGLLGGGAEGLYLWSRHLVTTRPAGDFYAEILWMAPLSGAATLTVLGSAVALLARGGSGGIGLFKASLCLGALAIHGVMTSEGIPLLPYAEVLVTLGLATMLARAVGTRPDPVRKAIRSSGRLILVVVGLLIGLGLWTAPGRLEARALSSLSASRAGLPNLLLVILDTVRARSLGLYGYERPTTPRIEAWAEAGVVFDRAIAPSSWTLPSHASLFTGQPDGVTLTGEFSPLSEEFTTLAEVLSAVGYGTAGFTANHWYTTSASGLDQGFAYFDDRPIDVPHFLWSSWLVRSLVAKPLTRATSAHATGGKNADTVISDFLAWLGTRENDRPFFAFLNLIDAHDPYPIPDDWAPKFTGGQRLSSWEDFYERALWGSEEPIGADEMAGWEDRYDEAIAYLDDRIGMMHGELEARGLLANTVVIITSDHGEMWGERGEIHHRRSLSYPSIHVPLVAIWPERIPPGTRVPTPVSIGDIPATFGELAGIDELQSFPGTSFVPTWASDAAPHPNPVADIRPYDGQEHTSWSPLQFGPVRSIVSEGFQLILRADGVAALFDVDTDPDMEIDLATDPAHAELLARLRALLEEGD